MRITGKRLLVAVLVLVAAVAAYFLFGRADNSVPLQVQVSGTAQAGTGGTYRASGTGVAESPFGSVSLSGAGAGSAQTDANCASFDGSGRLVTAAGTLLLRLAKPARACLTQATLDQTSGGLQVTATVQATGTTGSLLGRHGNLKARGSYDPETDRFTVLISGRLHH